MSGFISKLKFVPNMLTCSSAVCGMTAVILAFDGEKSLVYAAYLVFLACLFDFSDGFAARLLNAKSAIGKDLDSLADAVSFGVAPTAIMYQLLKQAMRVENKDLIDLRPEQILVLMCSLSIVIFSILRLAKFNVSTDLAYGFKGLATPANAMLVASVPLINQMVPEDFWIYQFLHFAYDVDFPITTTVALIAIQVFVFGRAVWLLPMCLFYSALEMTDLPMFSLKMKSYKYKDNKLVYNFLIVSALLLLVLQWIAVPIIIFNYVLVSFIKWLIDRKKANAL